MTKHPPPSGSFQGLVKNPCTTRVPTLTFRGQAFGTPDPGLGRPPGAPAETGAQRSAWSAAVGPTAARGDGRGRVFYALRFSDATKHRTGRTLGPAGQPTMRTGLLLINLGTPDAPTTPAVRRYLREFLGDPRVLDI